MKKILLIATLLTMVIFLLPSVIKTDSQAFAQIGGGTGGEGGPGSDAGNGDVPIDGGASILVGAAAVYGAKRLKKAGKDHRI